MIEEYKMGSGFDNEDLGGRLVGVPICHVCQHRIWGNDERQCEIYESHPERYIAECKETNCECLKIDEQVVFYDFFKERIEKGEIKNGTKA